MNFDILFAGFDLENLSAFIAGFGLGDMFTGLSAFIVKLWNMIISVL